MCEWRVLTIHEAPALGQRLAGATPVGGFFHHSIDVFANLMREQLSVIKVFGI